MRDDWCLIFAAGVIRWSSRAVGRWRDPLFNDCALDGAANIRPPDPADGAEYGRQISYLRQNAADCHSRAWGGFVPRSHIGLIDRVQPRRAEMIWRVAARPHGRDDGNPVFSIRRARALVILDEIGRGTATFDGCPSPGRRLNICMTLPGADIVCHALCN